MIHQKLQIVRKKLNLSQSEISTQIGISNRVYSSYERGERKPSLEFLRTISLTYNINLNWLIADNGEMYNTSGVTQIEDKQLFEEVKKSAKKNKRTIEKEIEYVLDFYYNRGESIQVPEEVGLKFVEFLRYSDWFKKFETQLKEQENSIK